MSLRSLVAQVVVDLSADTSKLSASLAEQNAKLDQYAAAARKRDQQVADLEISLQNKIDEAGARLATNEANRSAQRAKYVAAYTKQADLEAEANNNITRAVQKIQDAQDRLQEAGQKKNLALAGVDSTLHNIDAKTKQLQEAKNLLDARIQSFLQKDLVGTEFKGLQQALQTAQNQVEQATVNMTRALSNALSSDVAAKDLQSLRTQISNLVADFEEGAVSVEEYNAQMSALTDKEKAASAIAARAEANRLAYTRSVQALTQAKREEAAADEALDKYADTSAQGLTPAQLETQRQFLSLLKEEASYHQQGVALIEQKARADIRAEQAEVRYGTAVRITTNAIANAQQTITRAENARDEAIARGTALGETEKAQIQQQAEAYTRLVNGITESVSALETLGATQDHNAARAAAEQTQANNQIDETKKKLAEAEPKQGFWNSFIAGLKESLANSNKLYQVISRLQKSNLSPTQMVGAGLGMATFSATKGVVDLATGALGKFFQVGEQGFNLVKGWVTNAASLNQEIVQFSMQTGIAINQSQQLVSIFHTFGLDTMFTAIGIGGLSKQIAANNKYLTDMDIATRNANGSMRSTMEVLTDLNAKYHSLTEEGQRAFIANMNNVLPFASTIMPLITGNLKLIDTLRQMGVVLDDVSQHKLDEVTASFEVGQNAVAGFEKAVAIGLAPALKDLANVLANELIKYLPKIEHFFSVIGQNIHDFLVAVGLLNGGIDAVAQVTDNIEQAGSGGGVLNMNAYADSVTDAKDATADLDNQENALNDTLDAQQDILDGLKNTMQDQLDAIDKQKQAIEDNLADETAPIQDVIDKLNDEKAAWGALKDAASDAIQQSIDELDLQNAAITRNMDNATRPLRTRLADLQAQKKTKDTAHDQAIKNLGPEPESPNTTQSDIVARGLKAQQDALQGQIKVLKDSDDAYGKSFEARKQQISDTIDLLQKQGQEQSDLYDEQQYLEQRAYLMGQTLLAQEEARERALSYRQSLMRQNGESDVDYQLRIQELNAQTAADNLKRQQDLQDLDSKHAQDEENKARQASIDLLNEESDAIDKQIKAHKDATTAATDQLQAQSDTIQAQLDAIDAFNQSAKDAYDLQKDAYDASKKAIDDAYNTENDALEGLINTISDQVDAAETAAQRQIDANTSVSDSYKALQQDVQDFYDFFKGNPQAEALSQQLQAAQQQLIDINTKIMNAMKAGASDVALQPLYDNANTVAGTISNLQTQLIPYKDTAAPSGINGLSNDVQTLQDQLDGMQKSAKKLEDQLDKDAEGIKAYYQPQIDSQQTIIDNLQKQIKLIDKQKQAIQQANSLTDPTIADASDTFGDLSKNIKDTSDNLRDLQSVGSKVGEWVKTNILDPFKSPRQVALDDARDKYSKLQGPGIVPFEKSQQYKDIVNNPALSDKTPSPAEAVQSILSNAWEAVAAKIPELVSKFVTATYSSMVDTVSNSGIGPGMLIAAFLIKSGIPAPLAIIIGASGNKELMGVANDTGTSGFVDTVWKAFINAVAGKDVLYTLGNAAFWMVWGTPPPLAIILGAAMTVAERFVATGIGALIDSGFVGVVWSAFKKAVTDPMIVASLVAAIGLAVVGVPIPLAAIFGAALAITGKGIEDHIDDGIKFVSTWAGRLWSKVKDFATSADVIGVLSLSLGWMTIGMLPPPIAFIAGAATWFLGKVLFDHSDDALGFVSSWMGKIWDKVKSAANDVKKFVSKVLAYMEKGVPLPLALFLGILDETGALDNISDMLSDFGSWLEDHIAGPMIDFFTKLPDRVKAAFSGIGDAIESPFIDPIKSILGFFEDIAHGIGQFLGMIGLGSLADSLKSFVIDKSDITLPGHAEGARVDREEIARIGEGNVPEYVISTNPKHRSRSLGLMSQLAGELGVGGGGKGGLIPNPVDIIKSVGSLASGAASWAGNTASAGFGALKDAGSYLLGLPVDLMLDGVKKMIEFAADHVFGDNVPHLFVDTVKGAGEFAFNSIKDTLKSLITGSQSKNFDLNKIFHTKFPVKQGFGPADPDVRSREPGGFHEGIDIGAPFGTPLYSPGGVSVWDILQQGNDGYGLSMWLKTMSNGLTIILGHLSSTVAKVGDKLTDMDQIIAYSGNSGNSTGPHTHVEVRDASGTPVNPTPYFLGGVMNFARGAFLRPNTLLMDQTGEIYGRAGEAGAEMLYSPANFLKDAVRAGMRSPNVPNINTNSVANTGHQFSIHIDKLEVGSPEDAEVAAQKMTQHFEQWLEALPAYSKAADLGKVW